MPHVEFLVSNNRHHWAMTAPVLADLVKVPGYTCGLVSLAELRGMSLSADLPGGIRPDRPVARAVATLRRRVRFASHEPAGTGAARRLARAAIWRLWLGRRVTRRLRHADLVVTPNDAAFPYDRICTQLRRLNVPFLLLQEGIRFPVPAAADVGYGQGGAAAVAAWGERSAAYFRSRGVPSGRVHLTGNPRFDGLGAIDWTAQAAALGRRVGAGRRNVLVLTSPLDLMGFTTARGKSALLERFFDELSPLFADEDLHLLVKLHAAESTAEYAAVLARVPYRSRVRILEDVPLFPLLHLSQAAVVFASTVGLEAMLFGVPVGVVELPGAGFVHDYVSSGAAAGLTWASPMAPQVRTLLVPSAAWDAAVAQYVSEHLATREGATDRVVKLICDLVPAS